MSVNRDDLPLSTLPQARLPEVMSLEALYGGTFDPIHYGHLRPVIMLAQQLGLRQVTLLPNNVPPHRPQPQASAQQRLEMLRLAVVDQPLLTIDDRELKREAPSYTIDTLESLRQQRGMTQPLAFIIGQDSLLTLHKWHRWQELLQVCHLLVCARPGYASQMETAALQQWLEQHLTQDIDQLQRHPSGYIYLATTPLVAISATEIRRRRQLGIGCDDLLPAAVLHYIESQGLYR